MVLLLNLRGCWRGGEPAGYITPYRKYRSKYFSASPAQRSQVPSGHSLDRQFSIQGYNLVFNQALQIGMCYPDRQDPGDKWKAFLDRPAISRRTLMRAVGYGRACRRARKWIK